MLRAAIVGLGWWGRTLVESVQGASREIRFTHACTATPEKATDYCAKQEIRLADSFDALLADPEVDAVVLATPNSLHAGQIELAAAAGKHVFVEKPFALSAADARSALAAARRAAIVVGIGLSRRFHPSMAALHRRVSGGELGTVGSMIAELTAMTAFHRAPGTWRTRAEEEPAGAMASIGVHLVDAMIWMQGRVREVHCIAANRGGPHGADTTSLLLRFATGATGLVYCSVAAARNFRIAAYGTRGFAEVATPAMGTFRFVPAAQGAASHLAQPPAPEVIETPAFNYVGEALAEFARCIRGGQDFPVSHADILHGIEVLEAAVRSAASGSPVAFRDEG